MKTALIGYTGFVGGNIKNQHEFDDYYNSKNISDIEGKEYDLVVSAANRAEMWRINQEPEVDRAEIEDFISHIETAKIKKLVLISTVGVYKNPNGANEDTPIETEGLLPYGVNRYYLEQFCRDNFDTTIVRLPGLFGDGLKKNKPEGIKPAYWDMHSKYASVYEGEGEYLYTKEQELDDIKKFVARSR